MTMMSIKRTILFPKQVVNVLDIFGYLVGVEKDFPEQLYPPYLIKRKETNNNKNCHNKKSSYTIHSKKRG